MIKGKLLLTSLLSEDKSRRDDSIDLQLYPTYSSSFFKRRRVILYKLFSILLTLLFFNSLAAQNSSGNQTNINWIQSTTVNGVKFYYSIAACDGKNVVLLKLNNTNNHKVEVSWKELFTTEDNSRLEGYSGKKSLLLPPGELFEINCKNITHKDLLIFSHQVSPTYVPVIQKFDFNDINVTKAK